MNRLSVTLLLLGLSIVRTSVAEKAPIKYGDVSLEELTMTVYEADTSAQAVILCDYGYFNSTQFQFTHLTRIKILKKEGYSWANKTFPPYKNAFVRGITFNLENGEIIESKLKSESIFKEKIYEGKERLRITMPNVKVGSVIDIEFVYNWIPNEWKFQEEIPVKWSELKIENSPYVSFRKNFFGFEPLAINENNHWIAKDMPAFKPEPYISSPENYLTKLEFDILDVKLETYYEAYTTSWEDLSDLLYDSDYFGVPMRNDSYLNKISKEILAKAKTDEDKLRMAHDFIKSFKWNEYESLFTSNSSIGYVMDDHSGNSADVNIALIQLLEKLGFQVSAVLLSTRENGFLSPIYPSLNKLNYVIAKVNLNEQQLLIDGTEEYAPYYLLPERCLNLFGRLYNRDNSETVNLVTSKKDKELIYYILTLDESLQLSGTLSSQKIDYAALDFRLKYKSFSSQDSYLENMLKEYPGLRIQSATIDNIDSLYLPVKDKYEIILKNQVDEVGENLYLYPMLLHRLEENPFKANKRNYPIDFIHNYEKTYVVTITLPESLEVTGLPEVINMKLPDNSAYFYYQISNFGKTIQFSFKFGINKTIFVEDEYQNIKEFYNQIIAKHAEPIILKRK
jgi:hypothetical protein